MNNITINSILSFDEQSGLKISSKGEILEDLIALTRIAYGEDYAIEQGNEWYSFLDLLAGSLADVGGSVQQLYNTLSFTGASGTNLDNVVSFVGIARKPKTNSSVMIKATIADNSTIARSYALQAGAITLEDTNGNKWVNKEELVVEKYKNTADNPEEENYVGTATFEATNENADPTNIVLQPYNDGTNNNLTILTSGIPEGITFINEVASKLGNQEETDAQLRARYKKELYRESVGTVEGVIAQIEEDTNANYVYIVENNSSQVNDIGMAPHSIWVITNGKSEWDGTGDTSDYPDDIAIAQTILDYKSLGCGTSIPTAARSYNPTTGEGQISVDITIDSTTYTIQFSRASGVSCYVKLELDTNLEAGSQRDSIEYQIKQNIANYINNLGISNDVLYSGVSSAVYSVISTNNYEDFVIDIDSLNIDKVSPAAAKRVSIDYNEYAKITAEDITITWNQI